MIIYFALLIPVIVALVLYFFYAHKTVWWEFAIPFLASIILVLLLKLAVDTSTVRSEEYWGSMVDRVEYYEKWDEWIDEICYRQCCCDSKGQNCSQEPYDCSYKKTHKPYWTLINTLGEELSISQREYGRIKRKLGNEKFVNMNRDYYHIDGDMYFSSWGRDSSTAVPVTTLHWYENKIKATDASVFKFLDVDTGDVRRYSLKEYPPILDNYKMESVLGDTGMDARIAEKKMQYINGTLGHSNEMRAFLLVFKNQPMDAAFKQEAYWQGVNMNEFVVCVGIDDDRNVKWCKVLSWTYNRRLKSETQDMVMKQKRLNLRAIADELNVSLREFQRRDFREFDYLTVEPSLWAIIGCYLLVIAINVGISAWVISNEHSEKPSGYLRW